MYLYVPAGISDFFSPFFYCYDYALLSIFLLFRLRGFYIGTRSLRRTRSCHVCGRGVVYSRDGAAHARPSRLLIDHRRAQTDGWDGQFGLGSSFFFFLFQGVSRR